MGLHVCLDCGCLTKGLLNVPERWRGRLELCDGEPRLRGSTWGDEQNFEISVWYRSSCAHQSAANELTSARFPMICALAERVDANGFPAICNLFIEGHESPPVQPATCLEVLRELDALEAAAPLADARPCLFDDVTGEVLVHLYYEMLCVSKSNAAGTSVDDAMLSDEGVVLSRTVLVPPDMECGTSTELLRTRRFEQVPIGEGREGADFCWRDIESGKEVVTPLAWMRRTGESESVVSRVRFEMHRHSAKDVCAPLRCVCQTAVEAGTAVKWSWR